MAKFNSEDLIYVWGYTAGEIEFLANLHKEHDFPPPRPIFEEQLDLTIEEILAGGEGTTPKKQPPVRIILLPQRCTDGGIKFYLTTFTECGLPRPIFAAITDSNKGWTFTFLVKHLMEEQAEMVKRSRT